MGAHPPPPSPQPRAGHLPLSFAQQRLWFLDQLEPGSAAYNMPAALRLEGALDVAALRARLRRAGAPPRGAAHHLRRSTDGQPVQVIHPACSAAPAAWWTSAALPAERARPRPGASPARRRARPSTSATGPLLRATLLRLARRRARARPGDVHHIVSDGWSMGVLVREVAAALRGLRRGAALAAARAARAVRRLRRSGSASGCRASAGAAARLLAAAARRRARRCWSCPRTGPRPPVQTYRGAPRRRRACPASSPSALKALCQREGATPFMVLLAAFQAAARTATPARTTSLVGSPIAGRNRAETEGLIGFFVNTLVLRTGLAGRPSFRELLGQVRETTLGAYAHQDVPFEQLVEELQPAARPEPLAPLPGDLRPPEHARRPTLGLPGLDR